jgi:hypothetical protein
VTVKPDEIAFMAKMLDAEQRGGPAYGDTPRDVWPEGGKRMWGILAKWSRRDWYDYGVTIDLGWLTPAGVVALREIVNALPPAPAQPSGPGT